MAQLGLGLGAQINGSNSFDPDALRYFTTAGVTDATGKSQINTFVRGIKSLGLYNNMVCWPLRSTQNAGTGVTAYSLGGLGVFNGTLINGPTWQAGGIVFNGTTQYIDTAFTTALSAYSVFSTTEVTASGARRWEFAKDNVVARQFGLYQESSPADVKFYQSNSAGLTVTTADAFTSSYKTQCLRGGTGINKFRRNNGSDTNGPTGTVTVATVLFRMGALGTAVASNFFLGKMAGTIIFNTDLTDSQTSAVYALYQSSLGAGLGLPDADASAYIARAGVTDETGKQQINDFVVGVKNLGLYNNMVAWPLRSTQNAGTGVTAYSLGNLGTFDGTLTNGPTWGTGGVTFDATNDFISTTLTTGFSEITAFSIATPASNLNFQLEIAKDDVSANREWGIFTWNSNSQKTYVFNPTQRVITGPAYQTTIRSLCMRASSTVNKFRRNNEADGTALVGTLTQASAAVTIGAQSGGGGQRFLGEISASIVFNKALTDSETSSMYTLYKTTLGSGLGLP